MICPPFSFRTKILFKNFSISKCTQTDKRLRQLKIVLLQIRLNNLKRYIGLSSKTYKQRSKCFLIQTDLLELKLLDPLFLSIYSILELALLLPITKKLEKLADESLEAVDEISVVVFYTTSSWQWYKRKRMKKCLFVLKVFKLRTLLDTESITKWDVLLLLILGR